MDIEGFKDSLVSATKRNFPESSIILTEEREITLEARVKISEVIILLIT